MRTLIIITFLLHPIISSLGSAQKFPFTEINNRILIHIDTLNFILDTGATNSLLDSTLARRINLPFYNEIILNTPAGLISAIRTDFSYSQFPESKNWALTPFDTITQYLGYQVHGILGASDVLTTKIIDINFKTKELSIYSNEVNRDIPSGIEYELIANNNNRFNYESIGQLFPILPAIRLPMVFNKTDTIKTNMVIDTGCQFAFAFVTNDSTMINSNSVEIRDYISINGISSAIAFGEVSFEENNQYINFFSPYFYSPVLTNPINNSFYGLLGVLFFSHFERIIINWPKRKIQFIN